MDTYAHKAYEATAALLGYHMGNVPENEVPLLMLYALLTLVRGEDVTAEDVHDAWAVWTVVTRQRHDHPSLVPFDDLPGDVKALDDHYVEAIRLASRG